MRFRPPFAVAGAAALAIAVPLVGSATPASAVTKQEKMRGQQTNVYVQGDSLTVGAAPVIKHRLGPDVAEVAVDAQVGRFTETGVKRLARDGHAQRSRVWVVALGTNDGPDPQRLRHFVTRTLSMAGPQREVIWLTVHRPGGYGRVNTMLRKYDAADDRLHLVDWARTVQQRPGLIAGDGVHGTAAGYQVRGALISDLARTLAQQG
ncbi:MAG: hypothetical protein V9E98_02785 [Candidatus Nanopelagicales bacterium]